MEQTIKQFLEFRKQFTPAQWHEINRIIDGQFSKKAAELQLDDEDVEVIKKYYYSTKDYELTI
ncbi:phage protein [Staphylococcus aureus]|nr:phage protein [Staphylococcus aureus]